MNSRQRRTRVLIVEDSPTAGRILSEGISRDPRLTVAGIATTASEAVAMAESLQPDVMTIDFMLPDDSGLRVIERVLQKRHVPIIVVSSLPDNGGASLPFRALAQGAVDIVAKPSADPESLRAFFHDLNGRLATLADGVSRAPVKSRGQFNVAALQAGAKLDCVAVGASTGGPPALIDLLMGIGPDFELPIVIVQHIAAPFVEGLVRWLDKESPIKVTMAHNGIRLEPQHAYVAPGGANLVFAPRGRLSVRAVPSERRAIAPSVDALFESAAEAYRARCAGVLLSGMGRDGAMGLLKMRAKGAPTFAQAKNSCMVFGMPAEAGRLGAVQVFAEPREIAVRLRKLVATGERASK